MKPFPQNLSLAELQHLLEDDTIFTSLDNHFASFINRLARQSSPELGLAAALLSNRTNKGNICIDLRNMAGQPVTEGNGSTGTENSFCCPSLKDWLSRIKKSEVVGQPGDMTPLILDQHGRLYLRRYWEYENRVASFVSERSIPVEKKLDYHAVARDLTRLFPSTSSEQTNWQKIAAFAALTRFFCIISGGPGTGKTYTVAKILALLQKHKIHGRDFRILLGAPTGKAAARLQESLADISVRGVDRLPQALTIHRMLGSLPNSPSFKHNSKNPLHADVIIVDEASMVDLPLMAKLMQAVEPGAQLILLGDRHQLASVQPGSVLGDICHPDFLPCFTKEFQQLLIDVTGDKIPIDQQCNKVLKNQLLQDCIVDLKHGYRFSSGGGIEILSRTINTSDVEGACAILSAKKADQVAWQDIPLPDDLPGLLKKWPGFTEIAAMQHAQKPTDCFPVLNRNRILCGLRRGPYGAEAINKVMVDLLQKTALNGEGPSQQQGGLSNSETIRGPVLNAGQPVMITQNDYNLQLFNGDVGIMLPDPDSHYQLRVCFINDAGEIRKIVPTMLPAYEIVYAMTVHKSQGSEFDNVLLILPDRDAPVLTRELLYTAITRARHKVEIWGQRDVFRSAVGKQTLRESGLHEMLWTK
jgi:exodeoxyribonuclease V alpha subunit